MRAKPRKWKGRVGSLHGIRRYAERQMTSAMRARQAAYHRAVRMDENRRSHELERKAEELAEKSLTFSTKPSPRVENEIRQLRRDAEVEEFFEDAGIKHLLDKATRMDMKADFWNAVKRMRSTKTGKAIRLATGGPKLWTRTRRVKRERAKQK